MPLAVFLAARVAILRSLSALRPGLSFLDNLGSITFFAFFFCFFVLAFSVGFVVAFCVGGAFELQTYQILNVF
ncbi:unnamed protein product [Cercospora beticola]|nr:unnamed protein product [Cercospora beticola]